ncbi:MAG: DsbC family protein [Gammaproteobacteria bacterium]|nr:DsbC family protein [Gammaproteobacteria bacterium]
MKLNHALVAVVTIVICATSWGGAQESGQRQVSDEQKAVAVAKLQSARPDISVERVESTPIENMYAIELVGGGTFYATADGNYLISGDLYRITDSDLINLAEVQRDKKRVELIAGLDLKDMVIFAPEGQVKAVVNIFTDVDCGFCRKLHGEMADYNAAGIEVRYLAYPRAGIGSESYDKIVSAWCSDDRNDSITRLKRGETIPTRTCVNPVADQYNIGHEAGISGTPAIITDDGRLLPGYLPAKDLAQRLGI